MKNITQILRISTLVFFLLFGIVAIAQVGIGTTTPSTMLEVQANSPSDGVTINNIAGNGDPILQYQINGTSIISMGVDDSDADKFKIGTTGITNNTRMTIQSNGYIGIGTTTPLYNWHQIGNRNNYIAYFENTNAIGSAAGSSVTGTFNALGGITNNPVGLGSYGVGLSTTGANVGVWGTSNSSDAIGVQGSVPTTGTWLGFGGLFRGGLAYINGLYNLSDERVKTNIEPITNALSKIKRIKGVSYSYNLEKYNYLVRGDTRTYLGFLAQDIQETFPEAVALKQLVVQGDEKMGDSVDMSKFKREIFNVVDYTAIVPVLVEGIKEQQTIIENQNAKIKSLEQKLLILESKVNQLLNTEN